MDYPEYLEEQEELIPKLQVLDDMYADKGVVSMAARDYYYRYYANDTERKRMDLEDTISTIVGIGIYIGVFVLLVASIIIQ